MATPIQVPVSAILNSITNQTPTNATTVADDNSSPTATSVITNVLASVGSVSVSNGTVSYKYAASCLYDGNLSIVTGSATYTITSLCADYPNVTVTLTDIKAAVNASNKVEYKITVTISYYNCTPKVYNVLTLQ